MLASFAAFKQALSNGDGAEAARRVTPETLELYERCRAIAIDSTGTDFESLSQMEVLLTFQLRWLSPKATLETMDGAAIFAWGVREGVVKKDILAALELDTIMFEGAKATATLLNQDKPVTDMMLNFEHHGGVWKLDSKKLAQSLELAFAQMRKNTGKSKIGLAVYFMEQTYHQKIPPQILNGPLK